MKQDEVILKIEGITKMFPGVKALDHVQMTLHKGEVLALVGENGAGKSTLMKTVLGEYKPNEGRMYFKGEKYAPRGPADALRMGISMIHQELCLVPTITVSENIWLGHDEQFYRCGMLNKNLVKKESQKILDMLEVNVPPDAEVSQLSVANMQLVEIARAVSYNSDVVIMDEPTSALTEEESKKLFKIIRQLTKQGKGIIFISHKLDEIFEICDTVTVLRDGKYIDTKPIGELTQDGIVGLMVGRPLDNMFPKKEVRIGDVAMEVKGLTKKGVFEDVSFDVKRGEILGFVGLIGAGRTEIMQAIFGLDSYESGSIIINGKEAAIKSVVDAVKYRLAMVTEDRLRSGVIHKLPVKVNLTLPSLDKIRGRIFLSKKKENEFALRLKDVFSIKMASLDQEIGSLSGGNQQKAIIGRWLLMDPDIYILDEPTRGIDVGSKAEIYNIISELAEKGKAIIVVSSELQEIIGICDRAIIVNEGRLAGEFLRNEFDQHKMMNRAFGLM